MEKVFELAIKALIEEHGEEFAEYIAEAQDTLAEDGDDDDIAVIGDVGRASTFSEHGVLTTDSGLVVPFKADSRRKLYLTIQVQ